MSTDQTTLEKLITRIGESELSSPQIDVLATEALGLKAKDVASAFFDVLVRQPGEVVTTNLLNLFRELAVRTPEWQRILERSITKRGRCPRPLVSNVRGMLTRESKTLARGVRSVRELLADFETIIEDPPLAEQIERSRVSGVVIERKMQLFGSGKVCATVPMTMELSDIRRMDALASVLADLTPKPARLLLDFNGVEHVYVVGLAALKAWCKKMDIAPEVINVSDTTHRYLEQIGFNSGFEKRISRQAPSGQYYALAIEQISTDSQPEAIASAIVTIIDHHMPLSRKNRSGLIVLFAELVENVQRHAGISASAYACAQVYPRKNKLTISIVDTGIGIRESILTSSNSALISRVDEGEAAVRLACAPLVTSKPDKHSGYGLYVTSELIVRNGGTFRLFSGGEIFTCYRKQWQRKEHLASVSKGWNGTWIAMIVDLDSLLPVEDVYSILPPIPGVQLQDFF